MMRSISRRLLLTFCMLFGFASIGAAQSSSSRSEFVQHLGRPGYTTNTVYIWGAVGTPGVWEVEQNLDLIEVLSAARMIGLGTNPRGRQQYVVLTIYRDDGTGRQQVFRRNLEQILSRSDPLPSLQDGDVLTVAMKQRVGLQTISSVLGAGASITLLIIRLVQLAV